MKNVLALLADWANGIFAVLFAVWYTGEPLVWWYVPVGCLLASLPDIDALPELLRRGRVASSADHPHDHRTFLHWPIVALPLSGLAFYLGGFWGVVIALNIVLHLQNDMWGTGWGLQLFWPFSTRRYKLVARHVNQVKYMLMADKEWEQLPEDERRLRFITSWSAEEMPDYMKRWGIEDWIKLIYLTWNPIMAVEYVLFALAILLLFMYG